jgi:hypothetical protein
MTATRTGHCVIRIENYDENSDETLVAPVATMRTDAPEPVVQTLRSFDGAVYTMDVRQPWGMVTFEFSNLDVRLQDLAARITDFCQTGSPYKIIVPDIQILHDCYLNAMQYREDTSGGLGLTLTMSFRGIVRPITDERWLPLTQEELWRRPVTVDPLQKLDWRKCGF